MQPEQYKSQESPAQIKFQLKCRELRKIFIALIVVILLAGYCRFANLSLEQLAGKYRILFVYIVSLTAIIRELITPFANESQLNQRVLLIEKLILFLTCYLIYQKQSKYDDFTVYEFLPTFGALQITLASCSTFSWQQQALNGAFNWSCCSLVIVFLLGVEKSALAIVGSAACTIFQVQRVMFNDHVEEAINDLYSALMEKQQLLYDIFQYLPEGVLISSNQNEQKIKFWNSSAIDILMDQSLNLEQSANVGINLTSLQDQLQEQIKNIKIKKIKNEVQNKIDSDMFLQQHRNEIQSGNFEQSPAQLRTLRECILLQSNMTKRYIKLETNNKHLEMFKIDLKNGQETIIFMRDITIILEQQKTNTQEQLKSVLLSSISHDLKTPINTILASNEKLCENHRDMLEIKILKMQRQSCFYMLSLIDDIIDLSKFQLNKFELQKEEFNLRQLIQETQEMMEFRIRDKKLEFLIELDPLLPKNVKLDRKRLKQVLINLLSNALKFTFVGSITFKVYMEQQLLQTRLEANPNRLYEEEKKEGDFENETNQSLIFEVIDTGIGITEQNQKKLFKIFGTIKGNQQINPNGSGLGLVICKRIVEAMNGLISVTSQDQQGSTFKVSILLDSADLVISDVDMFNLEESMNFDELDDISAFYSSSEIHKSCNRNSLPEIPLTKAWPSIDNHDWSTITRIDCSQCSKYLIIDDDSFNILALELLVSSINNFGLDSCTTGLEGINQLQAKLKMCCGKPYEIVFVDLNMPVMNGDVMMLEVKKMIQSEKEGMERYRGTKFILCTAQPESLLGNYKAQGFSAYLEKPIQKEKLSIIINL